LFGIARSRLNVFADDPAGFPPLPGGPTGA
jgi:hypothetical protein